MNTRTVVRRISLGALVIGALILANLAGATLASSQEPGPSPVSTMEVPF